MLAFIQYHWTKLCKQMGFSQKAIDKSTKDLDPLLKSWAHQPLDSLARPFSGISDDGFPVEFSVSWRKGVPEVRIGLEASGLGFSPFEVQENSRQLLRELANRPGVSIDRYLSIEDLFLSDSPEYPSIFWLSLAVGPDGTPHYKLYLSPLVRGRERAAETVAEAMKGLGMGKAWEPLHQRDSGLSALGHKVELLALDLEEGPQSRVKIYYRHYDVAKADLNGVAQFARNHEPLRANRIIDELHPDEQIVRNEPLTSLAFTSGLDAPQHANMYFRLRKYPLAVSDRRIVRILQDEGVDESSYDELCQAYGEMPHYPSRALQQEVLSFRSVKGHSSADLCIYFRCYSRQEAEHV